MKITTREASKLLGVRPQTMGAWRKKGIGPQYIRAVNGSILYEREEILRHQALSKVIDRNGRTSVKILSVAEVDDPLQLRSASKPGMVLRTRIMAFPGLYGAIQYVVRVGGAWLEGGACMTFQIPQLRDYQLQARASVLEQFRKDVRRVLLVMPTGAGKGTLAANVVASTEAAGNRCLFMVNRRELVKDMSKRLRKLGVNHGVIMAGANDLRNPLARTMVASKDTLQRRKRPPADLVFIDEAHFAVSDGWADILKEYEDAFILGMTATPIRLDGRGLGEFFDVIVEGPTVSELQAMGFLVPVKVYAPAAPDLTGVKKTGGDYNEGALAVACDKPKLIGDIVEHWQKLAAGTPTIVFAVNRTHSEHIRDAFLAAGVSAVAVDANTPSDERDATWERMERGEIQVVCSVGIVSYGWDQPCCKTAILARPTMSEALYLQQVGRILRPYPGKEYSLVLDHAGNTLKHGFVDDPREWSLEGRPKGRRKTDVEEVGVTMCRGCWLCFPSSLDACPGCGKLRDKKDTTPETVAGELVEVERPDPLVLHERFMGMQDEEARKKYEKLTEICRVAAQKNWKPAAPAMRFKAAFGGWPSKKWLESAKAAARLG